MEVLQVETGDRKYRTPPPLHKMEQKTKAVLHGGDYLLQINAM